MKTNNVHRKEPRGEETVQHAIEAMTLEQTNSSITVSTFNTPHCN